MSRKLRVKVSQKHDPNAVASVGMLNLPQRVLRKIRGQNQRCAVLLPGRDVETIEIIDHTGSKPSRLDDDFDAFVDALFGKDEERDIKEPTK